MFCRYAPYHARNIFESFTQTSHVCSGAQMKKTPKWGLFICGSLLPSSNVFHPEPELLTLTRASRTRHSHPLSESRVPSPCPRIFPCSDSRGGMLGMYGTVRARERLTSAHMSRSIQIPSGLWAVSNALNRPLTKRTHPSASASGLFPLWLRRPRFIGSRFSSHSRLWAGARSGLLFGGRKESFPQLRAHPRTFGFRPRTTPILVCVSMCGGIASASGYCYSGVRRPSSFSHGRS